MHSLAASAKQFAQDVVDGLRVGLAARSAHDLPDEKLEDAFVAGFVLGDVVGVFRNDVASGFDDGGFADLGTEAFGGDDVRGGTAGFEHSGDNLLAHRDGDFA